MRKRKILWCTVYSQYVPLTFEESRRFVNYRTLELPLVEMPKGSSPHSVASGFVNITLSSGVNTMTVVRYEPWSLVNRFQRDIDRLFSSQQTTAADSGAWLPPVDINEEDNQFLLHVDLPGVDPKAVEITSEQGRAHDPRQARRRPSAKCAMDIAASSGSPASSSADSICRTRRMFRTSRPKPSTACWKSRFRSSRRCSRSESRSRLPDTARRCAFLRVRLRIESSDEGSDGSSDPFSLGIRYLGTTLL